jgi:BirA family transcriptional regulator, biotin operon repressor / biotin---[acetyl-CoA-carboxylase] ligase
MRRIHFDITESTNTEARTLAAEHPGECLLVTAAMQSAGRGRHGRAWESPRGGAWLSLVWPTRQPPLAYSAVSLVAAIAIRRALLDVIDTERLQIKWPNDVLIDDRKVVGILCEQWPGDGETRGFVVMGVGINVDFDLALIPTDLRHPATTLSQALGHAVPVEAVIDAVALQMERALEDFEAAGLTAALIDELASSLAYVGTERSWHSPRGEINGRVMGIDARGRLLLEIGGTVEAHDVGEFAPILA